MTDITAATSFPLLTRDANDPVAIIQKEIPCLGNIKGRVTAAEFLRHVSMVADQLPDHHYVINLCDSRYLFAVVFCAAILRGQTNLLPPNNKELTQVRLHERYGDVYMAQDWSCGVDISSSLPQFELSSLDLNAVLEPQNNNDLFEPPFIDQGHLAAISFTSGSTGNSKPNQKTWRTIVESTQINACHMLAGYSDTLYQLSTVPPQHMWGLETSVFFPLFTSVCIVDAKPLFPQDILDVLLNLAAPRMLVSAPVHLRALCASGLSFPDVSLVLCATSPLSAELAGHVETLFTESNDVIRSPKKALKESQPTSIGVVDNYSELPSELRSELREVYGCSEVGSMAIRHTAREDDWQLFHGIDLSWQDEVCIAMTDYLPEPVVLQDRIVIVSGGHFKLVGRDSDMVDIAGKRGSLLELNKMLLSFPGIIDGVIFIPKSKGVQSSYSKVSGLKASGLKKGGQSRLAAMVVLPDDMEIVSLRDYIGKNVDNAFIPRPIIKVDALPREENGKLPAQCLNEFYQQVK
jgi:acyl-coenzyme A synthetase/AMP-(fatty) acid ligase